MPVSNPKETIDPRILRLIGLDDVFDLDYDTYLTLLKEAMVKGRMPNTSIPTEEVELLTNEYKRVKTKKDQGRFEVRKKKISTGSFGVGKVKGLISPAAPKGLIPAAALSKSPAINKVEEDISAIAKSMNSIVEILSGQKKLNEDAAAYDKRKAEQDKRALAESKLEKRFEGLKKATEKILAPVKNILSKIIDFLTTVFLGRVVYKLIEWFGDPKNAGKVQSIIRFFGDHWPKLLSLYILFGTSFGRFARGLIRVAVKGTIRLGLAIAKLLAAKKVKGAMGVARFLGRGPGKLLGAGLTALGTAGLAYAGTKALEGSEDKAQGFHGGGFVIPRFSGGGFNFGSLFSGLVSGQKGVDKVPAMLTDGEFVMSAGAVQKYGVDTLEAMNAAGGGTNKPKIMGGTTYAAGGGLIGDIPIDYRFGQNPNDNALRQAARTFNRFGTEDELFKTFKKLGGVPDFEKLVGGKTNISRIFQGQSGADDALDAIRKSVAEKLKAVNNPQSFTQSSRAAKVTRIDPSRMLPAAGESSANAMRAAAKAARNARTPIPATSAIVPYTGGGLARTGVTGGLSVPQIRTNMNVPGGRPGGRGGPLAALFAALDFLDRKQEGQTNSQAALGAAGSAAGGQVGFMAGAKAGALLGGAIGAMFGGVGAGPGAIVGGIIGGLAGGFGGASLGGKLADDLSGVNSLKERMSRGGIGGSIKGGYGLKGQAFKDMPRTQIMTDEKGRPFVGYKAMRGGKPVYVRGPKPGTGTTNPLEMLGRMINPGAYRENDQRLAMQKQKVAMVNSLESLQARGASIETQKRMMKQIGGNLKDVQNDLNYRKKQQAQIAKTKPSNRRGAAPSSIRPPTKPAPKVVYGPPIPSSRPKNKRGGGTTRTPNFSARNPAASNAKQKVLGMTS